METGVQRPPVRPRQASSRSNTNPGPIPVLVFWAAVVLLAVVAFTYRAFVTSKPSPGHAQNPRLSWLVNIPGRGMQMSYHGPEMQSLLHRTSDATWRLLRLDEEGYLVCPSSSRCNSASSQEPSNSSEASGSFTRVTEPLSTALAAVLNTPKYGATGSTLQMPSKPRTSPPQAKNVSAEISSGITHTSRAASSTTGLRRRHDPITYSLKVRQQPSKSASSPHLLDPAPIVEVLMLDRDGRIAPESRDTKLVLHCTLRWTPPGTAREKLFGGPRMAAIFHAKDENDILSRFGVYPRLSCSCAGSYRLSFELIAMYMQTGDDPWSRTAMRRDGG